MKIRNTLIIGALIVGLFIGGCSNSGLSDNNTNNNTIKQEQKTDDKKPVKDTKKKAVKDAEEKTVKDNNKEKEDKPDPQSNKQDNKSETIKPVEERRNFVISTCASCGALIHENDKFKECKDYYLCIDCYNKGYCKCLNCGKTINGYDKDVSNGSSGSLCKECTEEYIYNSDNVNTKNYCSKCGKELDIDSSSSCTYDDNGNLLCLDCYFAENDQIGDMQE